MKKLCSLALVFVLIFTLAACGSSTALNESSTPTEQSVESNTDVSSLTSSTEEVSSAVEESSSTQAVTASSEATETTSKTAPVSSETPASSSKVETSSAAPVHTHSFAAANCTTPKTCSCGATEGGALGHNWTAATCTAPKTCSVCKATEGEALEHKWAVATCSSPKTCEVCAKTEGEALAHDFYAGECKICKAENPDWVRVKAKNGIFSVAVPKTLEYATENSGFNGDNSFSFFFGGVDGEYVSFAIPLELYMLEKAEVDSNTENVVISSDKYVITYGAGTEGDGYSDDIVLLNSLKQEILDSVRFE